MDSRVGQQLGDYRLLSPLGQGGFADVYLGEHVSDKTRAAIKVLRMQMPDADVDAFLREARMISQLKHSHIIRILGYGLHEEDNTPFLVMQYAFKGTLRHRHHKGAILTPGSILPYIKQVAAALQYAHDQKIVHRDVKPENMLLGPDDAILVSDFGLAIVMHGSSYQQSLASIDGTLGYMAPEQFYGKPRPASDQYALAVTVYEWLSGARPFVGTPTEIQAQHLQAQPPRLVGRNLAPPRKNHRAGCPRKRCKPGGTRPGWRDCGGNGRITPGARSGRSLHRRH